MTDQMEASLAKSSNVRRYYAALAQMRLMEVERDEAREELKAMREAIKNANHFASIILAEAGKQWRATEPLPDVASIEAVAQQIKDELQPFFKP